MRSGPCSRSASSVAGRQRQSRNAPSARLAPAAGGASASPDHIWATCRNGSMGSPRPVNALPRPHRAIRCGWSTRARRTNSASSAVLPLPGSPVTIAMPARPATTRSSASASWCSSSSRATKTGSASPTAAPASTPGHATIGGALTVARSTWIAACCRVVSASGSTPSSSVRRAPERLVLGKRFGAPPLELQEAHQVPQRGVLPRLELEPAARGRDRRLRVAQARVRAGQRARHRDGLPIQRLARARQPRLERRARDAEPLEERAAVEREGVLESRHHLGIVHGCVRLPDARCLAHEGVDVDPTLRESVRRHDRRRRAQKRRFGVAVADHIAQVR